MTLFTLNPNPPLSVVNTTTETTLFDYLMPGGTLPSNGNLVVTSLLDFFNNDGGPQSVIFKLYLGTTGTVLLQTFEPTNGASATKHVAMQLVQTIAAGTTTSQYVSGQYTQNSGAVPGNDVAAISAFALASMGQNTSALDTTSVQHLRLTAQLTDASPNLFVNLYSAKVVLT